jgi:hypothetical protein
MGSIVDECRLALVVPTFRLIDSAWRTKETGRMKRDGRERDVGVTRDAPSKERYVPPTLARLGSVVALTGGVTGSITDGVGALKQTTGGGH